MATQKVITPTDLGASLEIVANKVEVKVDGVTVTRGVGGALTAGAAPNVTVQQGIPTISPPTDPKKGDHVVVTSDGTAAGAVQSTWVYTGTAWVLMHSQPTNIVVAQGVRSYHPTTTALIENYTALPTAAQLTAQGFTAVGGAVNAPYGAFAGYFMSYQDIAIATVSNAYAPPTAYIRHEVAITSGVANTYFLRLLGDRKTIVEVWVCDPVSGVPVRRLTANGVVHQGAMPKTTIQLSPKEEFGSDSSYFEWVAWTIPLALVTAYKTAANTLKLAFRPGIGNQEGNRLYLGGWGVASNVVGYEISNYNSFDTTPNFGARLAYGGEWDGMGFWSIAANTTVTPVRVALPGTDKAVYLTLVGRGEGGPSFQWLNATILHVSGAVDLDRPRPHLVAPLAEYGVGNTGNGGLTYGGWLIPAATLAAKAVQPSNSGVQYLELALQNMNHNDAVYGTAFVVETVD
jgi:hypothetical protein